MPLLEVGRVLKAHGIKGEVIVRLTTDREERVAPGAVLQGPDGPLEVLRSSPHKGDWIVAFAGVADRSTAESMRGAVLRAEPLDDPHALWVHELIGADLVGVDGAVHGRVVSVVSNPASDLLELDSGALVPIDFVVGTEPGRVLADVPEGLFDL